MSDKKIVFEDGNAYGRMMGVWSQIVGKEFIEWLNPASGQSWIDIGCGTGAFTAQIAELCPPHNYWESTPLSIKSNSLVNAPWRIQRLFKLETPQISHVNHPHSM